MAADPASDEKWPKPLHVAGWPEGTPPVYDFLDPPGISQAEFLKLLQQGVRSDVPFVRTSTNK
jgi:hypothetical protein